MEDFWVLVANRGEDETYVERAGNDFFLTFHH